MSILLHILKKKIRPRTPNPIYPPHRNIKRQEHTNKAVIYAQYSLDSQRDESIEQQISECRSYAESKNITIIDTCCDYALSDTSDK